MIQTLDLYDLISRSMNGSFNGSIPLEFLLSIKFVIQREKPIIYIVGSENDLFYLKKIWDRFASCDNCHEIHYCHISPYTLFPTIAPKKGDFGTISDIYRYLHQQIKIYHIEDAIDKNIIFGSEQWISDNSVEAEFEKPQSCWRKLLIKSIMSDSKSTISSIEHYNDPYLYPYKRCEGEIFSAFQLENRDFLKERE